MSCQYDDTPIRLRPFEMIPMTMAPNTVPLILPLPPVIEVPPSTQAAMASSSYPLPTEGWPEYILEQSTSPANAERSPDIVNTMISIFLIGTPESLAASRLPPIAYTYVPNFVLLRMKLNSMMSTTMYTTGSGITLNRYPVPISMKSLLVIRVDCPPV